MKKTQTHRGSLASDNFVQLILKFAKSTVRKVTENRPGKAAFSPAREFLNGDDGEVTVRPGPLSRSRVVLQAFVTILLSRGQNTRHLDDRCKLKPALPQGAILAVRYVSR